MIAGVEQFVREALGEDLQIIISELGVVADLSAAYDDFFANTRGPYLVIDSNPLDFVRYPDHLKLIENRIREALGISPYQPALLDGD